MTHWESYKKLLVPTVSPLSNFYEESLERLKTTDWYEFQEELPFVNPLYQYVSILPEGLAYNQFRTVMEETYAVMCFEKHGCRIIKPSVALIQELLRTDCTFRLTDIQPPWPIVFIKIPDSLKLDIPDWTTAEMSHVDGIYVSWGRTSEKTQEVHDKIQKEGTFRRSSSGLASEPIHIADSIGNWFARIITVARGKDRKVHDWTIHYFNMHWAENSNEPAQDFLRRFEKLWDKTSKGLGAELTSETTRNQIYNLIANLFLYMSLPTSEGDIIWQPDVEREKLRTIAKGWNSKRRRSLKRKVMEEMRTEKWLVGQNITIQRETGSTKSNGIGTHKSPRTHWRRGHWRGVWTGPKSGPRKLVPHRIRPVLVMGSGKAPESVEYEVK